MDQQELLNALTQILPNFQAHWDDEDNYYKSDTGTFNLHNVCKALSHFYIDHVGRIDDQQQQLLFDCLDKELMQSEDSADAIKSGFIECIALTDAAKTAAPFMGPQARSYYQAQQENT